MNLSELIVAGIVSLAFLWCLWTLCRWWKQLRRGCSGGCCGKSLTPKPPLAPPPTQTFTHR